MGALYSTVSGLLAVISRAYPQFLSPVSTEYNSPGSSAVIVVLNREIHSHMYVHEWVVMVKYRSCDTN